MTLTQKTGGYCWDAELMLTKVPICCLRVAQQNDSTDEGMNSRESGADGLTKQNGTGTKSIDLQNL